MKTQIKELRSGTKNQILNQSVDYSVIPQATSHVGHSGSNSDTATEVWKRVISENPESLNAVINGVEVEMKANWSLSKKSVTYIANISREELVARFGLVASSKNEPFLALQFSNLIEVSNGKNSYRTICPSLVEIK